MSHIDIINKIICGDTIECMKKLPDACVDMCVTSPPYWNLRQYLFDNALIKRHDLTNDELNFLEMELKKHNVKPRI